MAKKCIAKDFHQINRNVPRGKAFDVDGIYIPNTDKKLVPSMKHQLKRLQSRYYKDKKQFGRSEYTENTINRLKFCIRTKEK